MFLDERSTTQQRRRPKKKWKIKKNVWNISYRHLMSARARVSVNMDKRMQKPNKSIGYGHCHIVAQVWFLFRQYYRNERPERPVRSYPSKQFKCQKMRRKANDRRSQSHNLWKELNFNERNDTIYPSNAFFVYRRKRNAKPNESNDLCWLPHCIDQIDDDCLCDMNFCFFFYLITNARAHALIHKVCICLSGHCALRRLLSFVIAVNVLQSAMHKSFWY